MRIPARSSAGWATSRHCCRWPARRRPRATRCSSRDPAGSSRRSRRPASADSRPALRPTTEAHRRSATSRRSTRRTHGPPRSSSPRTSRRAEHAGWRPPCPRWSRSTGPTSCCATRLTSGDLFERLVAGLGGLDADVVVTIGRELDPAGLGAQPAHVRIERFVPQGEVLVEADLVVSHGGSGSLMAALAHGLPSVLLPLGADQPHNALRASELGVATTLDAATATASEIGEAAAAALADTALAQRCREVADELASLPSVGTAVAALEVVAS